MKKKKFISKSMIVFIIVLAVIFITTYITSAILLINSNYSLTKYINNFNIYSDGFNISLFKYNINESNSYDLKDTLNSISISTYSVDIVVSSSPSDKIEVNVSGKAKKDSSLNTLFNINNSNSSEFSISEKSNLSLVRNLTLNISIPSKYNKKLCINSASSDISLSGLNLNEVNINNTSGDLNINNTSSSNTKINSTSGDINIGGNLGNMSINSTSGDIDLYLDKLGDSINISSCSGDIDLSNTETNYSLVFKTTSGDFYNETSQDYNKSINTYTMTSGNKNSKINVSTISGDFSFGDD